MNLERLKKLRIELLADVEQLPEQATGSNEAAASSIPSIDTTTTSRDPTLASLSKLSISDRQRLPATTLRTGDLAPEDQEYCPASLFARFPYKFLDSGSSQRVSDQFWSGGKFWQREWDLYYVWSPVTPDAKTPELFISATQATTLLDQVNEHFEDIQLEFNDFHRDVAGLVWRFPQHPEFRPRYLGRVNSKEQSAEMEKLAPPVEFRPSSETVYTRPSAEEVLAFKQWFEEEQKKGKGKNRVQQERKAQERLRYQTSIHSQLRWAQRYLGLRPEVPLEPIKDPKYTAADWAVLQMEQRNWEAIYHAATAPIDVEQPAQFPFAEDAVLVAFDVEAFEHVPSKITEVGISMLDTRVLRGLPPGEIGSNWAEKIHTRHFWIKEHKHLINKTYVKGCPDKFEFGQSEILTIEETRRAIAQCFTHAHELAGAYRPVVLIGHDGDQDVKYLKVINADLYSAHFLPHQPIIALHDTAALHQCWKQSQNKASLGSILYDFDLVGWNLHNAGNDSHYTMMAFVALAVKTAQMRGTKELLEEREKLAQAAVDREVKSTEERIREASLSWQESEAAMLLEDGERVELRPTRPAESTNGSANQGTNATSVAQLQGGGALSSTRSGKPAAQQAGRGRGMPSRGGYGAGPDRGRGVHTARSRGGTHSGRGGQQSGRGRAAGDDGVLNQPDAGRGRGSGTSRGGGSTGHRG